MSPLILVTGASGFIGRSVVDALLKDGYSVRAFTRSANSFTESNPQLEVFVGDIRNASDLERATSNVWGVVHLAAAKNDEPESEAINIGGTQNLIEACRNAGVQKIVNISTQSAKIPRKGLYGSTKEKADALLHASGLPVVTLRSSLVYGDINSGILGTIIRYSALPVIPMIGSGKAEYRPIHREDLASIIIQSLKKETVIGKTYDVGGPDLLSLNAITEKIMNARDVHKPIIHLPIWFALFVAKILHLLGKPIITVSNVLGSAVNVPMDIKPLEQALENVHMRSFDTGLQQLFGPALTSEEKEAKALLRYVLSAVGRYEPTREDINHYLQACAVHGATTPLDTHLIRSKRALNNADLLTQFKHPHSLLRKKLLIAAAIAEAQPISAEALLPKPHSRIGIVLLTMNYCIMVLVKILFAVPLLLSPSRLSRYAGTV